MNSNIFKKYMPIIILAVLFGIFNFWYMLNSATVLMTVVDFSVPFIGSSLFEFLHYLFFTIFKIVYIQLLPILILVVGLDTIDKIKAWRLANDKKTKN